MSAALRRAGGLLVQRLGGARSLQQQRANHDLAVHTNKHVEAWLSRREDIEREFRWTNKSLRDVVLLLLVVPTLMYNGIIWAAHKDDEYAGRTKRDFLWGHAQAGERQE